MKSIKGKMNQLKLDKHVSSYCKFKAACIKGDFSAKTIRSQFYKLVNKDDYDGLTAKEKKNLIRGLLEYASNYEPDPLTKTPEAGIKRPILE